MTEVNYGQFFDAFEDAAAPLADSNEQETGPKTNARDWLKNNSSLIAKLFRAMERINNNQLEGYDSTVSLSSSHSMGSMSSASMSTSHSASASIEPKSALDVFQSILINDFASSPSTNSLAAYETSYNSPLVVPALLQHMVYMFDEFMHNHTYLEDPMQIHVARRDPTDSTDNADTTDTDADTSSPSSEFPKFC
jgi:hypothetical protein